MSSTSEMKRVSTYEMLNKKSDDVESATTAHPDTRLGGAKAPANISWSGLNFTATVPGKAPVHILNDVWGTAKSGEVVCIMGSSGAGKSSLLNVLAGRSATGGNIKITGKITVNGTEINPQSWRKNIAYVMQDDALMATATPREALLFSASLRLPQTISAADIKTLVDKTLTDLALDNCADTFIGGPLIKGISGGQRKRTSVGVEIITQPSLLFLDEPTSGLDSFSAFNCVALLKKLAKEQQTTVLCTIHQPASEVFFQFDKCIFMRSGRIFYQGSTDAIVSHFSRLGEVCPPNYNPSDFIMALSQRDSVEQCEKLGMFMNLPTDFQHEGPASALTVVTATDGSEESAVVGVVNAPDLFTNQAPFSKQLYFLMKRECENIVRDIGALIGRFGVTIFLNVLFGLIFLDAGGKDDSNIVNFNGHFGSLTMVTIASMFGCAQPVMLLFPFERPLFLREYSTGTYTGIAYFISKTACELPMTLAQTCLQYLFVYFMCNYQGNGIYLILIAWALGAASCSVACCLGSAVSDVKTVTELAPLLFVPQMLFAGFFIQTGNIPVFLRWAQYACSLKYAMNLLILTEFNPANKNCQGGAAKYCNNIIAQNDIDESAWWIYILVLVALFVGFRMLGAYILIEKAKTFY